MQSSKNGNNMVPMAEINVTPLVDVMLVLLIIFMLAAPHLEQGVSVDLPNVSATPLPREPEDDMVLTVTRDKEVFLNEIKISIDKVEPVLKEAMGEKPVDQIYLRADENVPYGFVVQVMAAARRAGIPGLGMVTDPEEIKSP